MRIDGIQPKSLRFGFSPLQETLRALHVLTEPRHHAEQMGWMRGARRRLTPPLKAALRRHRFLLHPVPELFFDLLPSELATTFYGELDLLCRNLPSFRSAMVRRMMDKRLLTRSELAAHSQPASLKRLALDASLRQPGAAELLSDFVAKPERVLSDFCVALEALFESCLASQWERFESQARSDAALRKRLLQRFGVAAMLRTLTRELSVEGDRRRASVAYGGKESAGRQIDWPSDASMVLTPSYFIWPHASFVVLQRDVLDVRIAYPLMSVGTSSVSARRWEAVAKRLAALSDPTRLQMLNLLNQRDLSTREFAGLLGFSESTISRHLSIMRDAALVTSTRDGYFVLYQRAPAGFRELLEVMFSLQESEGGERPSR